MLLPFIYIAVILAALSLQKLEFTLSFNNGSIDTALKLGLITIKPGRKKSNGAVGNNKTILIIKALYGVKDKLRKYLRLEKLKISYLSADRDPYNAVMKYNIVNTVMRSALLFAENSRNTKNVSINSEIRFSQENSEISAVLGISVRVWQVIALCFRLDKGVLKSLIKTTRKEETHGKQIERNDAISDERRKKAR